ncbi:hypothetical protein Trydic_g15056 [Trypoxylus dichotomus]
MLLSKRSAIGMSTVLLRIMASCLNNRQNYVYYNGFRSYEFVSTSGVPEDPNLGPLPFITFTNDLLEGLNCHVFTYADDVEIYTSISSVQDTAFLRHYLNSLVDWCFTIGNSLVLTSSFFNDPGVYFSSLN